MNTSTNYLEQYDAAPDADKFPMVRRWIDTEPLPFFKELRAKRPILVTPTCTLVTRFDDVREILKMYKVFTVKPYVPKMANYLMMHDDDALHTREKSLMQFMLNRDDLPKVRAMVGDISQAILGKANGQIGINTILFIITHLISCRQNCLNKLLTVTMRHRRNWAAISPC